MGARAATGVILVGSGTDPHVTADEAHRRYHEQNRRAGRLPGQLRLRLRSGDRVGAWFDYLLISPSELDGLLPGTGWRRTETCTEGASYVTVLEYAAAASTPLS
jgi:hypothetical protein